MLPIIVFATAVVFLILWKSGILDEISGRGFGRKGGDGGLPPDDIDPLPPDSGMRKRLRVFENFIEELSGEDEPADPDPGD